jgi:diphthamide synthase (EF-2-diphthine--ammonia ligase)
MTTFQELHRIACETGADTYSDPKTGYRVFTEHKLLRQGDCCGNACRHCPFGHIKVSNPENEPRIQKPVVLGRLKDGCDCFDVLFWSGGKDSFLCLSHLLENDKNIVLLTTFSVDTNRVPIQNVHIKDIVQQASFFNVPVCLVPLPQNANYRDTVSAGLRAIEERMGANVTRICFGDLHLQDLLNWRVETWPQYEVFTPLFGRPYQELLELLWKSTSQYDVSIHLSTEVQLPNAVLPIGTTYDKALVERLQRAGVDAMLEFGEGHTLVLPNRNMTKQPVSSQYELLK